MFFFCIEISEGIMILFLVEWFMVKVVGAWCAGRCDLGVLRYWRDQTCLM